MINKLIWQQAIDWALSNANQQQLLNTAQFRWTYIHTK